jgi:hypothetical protein
MHDVVICQPTLPRMTRPEKLFRQVSLERLSSPEQLDVMVQVVTPRLWLLLLPLLALLLAVLTWAVWGRVAATTSGRALLVDGAGGRLEAVVCLPAGAVSRVEPGMAVHLALDGVEPQQSGYLLGEVRAVADRTATHQDLHRLSDDNGVIARLSAAAPVVEVRVALLPGDGGGVRWSIHSVRPPRALAGSEGRADIVTARVAPIAMLFPALDGAR